MTKKQQIDKEIKILQKVSTELLKSDKFLATVAFVYTKKENLILDLIDEFSSESAKQEFIPHLASKLFEEGGKRIIFLQEGIQWIPPKEMTQKEISDIKSKELDPMYFNKQEIISILDITKDYSIEYSIPFNRIAAEGGVEKIKMGRIKSNPVILDDLKQIQTSLKLVR
jgi:hypothetical protein